MLNGLDLFSGIGGMSIALGEWVRPIAYCENDSFAQSVLLSRMSEGLIPLAPIWDDVKTFMGKLLPAIPLDVIYGGFPCQDISIAGNGKGLEGERSGLFFEVMRLCSEIRPRFIFLENVSAIAFRGGKEIIGEITALGYDCRWLTIPSGYGLEGFRGNRWFCVAKAKSERLETSRERCGDEAAISMSSCEVQTYGMDWREPAVEPGICGIPFGLPHRMDRIKSLGNSVLPIAQARKAFKLLIGLEAFNGYDSP